MEYVSLPRIIVKAGYLDIANCDRSYICIRFWTRTFIVSSTSTTQCVHANPKMLDTSSLIVGTPSEFGWRLLLASLPGPPREPWLRWADGAAILAGLGGHAIIFTPWSLNRNHTDILGDLEEIKKRKSFQRRLVNVIRSYTED